MRVLAILAFAVGIGCGPGERQNGSCNAGETRCDGLTYQVCVGGKLVDQETCAMACSEGLGCTACEVGTATCNGNIATVCNESGTGFVDIECDPVQGMTCDPQAGGCVGDCAPASLGTGCGSDSEQRGEIRNAA